VLPVRPLRHLKLSSRLTGLDPAAAAAAAGGGRGDRGARGAGRVSGCKRRNRMSAEELGRHVAAAQVCGCGMCV
jgi:hypothetical protein